MAALAVLLIFGTAGILGSVFLSVSDRTTVLVVTRPVAAGTVIERDDLGTAELAGSGVTAIAAADAPSVIGKTAVVDLVEGTLLAGSMVTREPFPGPGQAVVGVALKPGFMPSTLREGSVVQVVRTPLPTGESAEDDSQVVIVPTARVMNVQVDETSGGTIVDVAVDAGKASEVARSAAAGRVSLVEVGR
jgi:Flp pilus assembly protein CpaB